MESPLVSVVIPTYNREELLPRAIKSVIAQTYTNWELLIVDDGSTDNTKEVVEEFTKSDKRIKYYKNNINLGLQKTLNKGIRMAKGKYIARIDDDDEWVDKEKLQKQLDFLESHKDYVLIGTNAIFVNESGKELFNLTLPQGDIEIRRQILKRNCFIHTSVIFNKDVAIKVGGYSELPSQKHIEDYDLWLKIGLIGKMYNLQDYSVKYLVSQNSITAKYQQEQYLKAFYLTSLYKNKYPKYYSEFLYKLLKLVLFGYLGFLPIFNRKNRFKYKNIFRKK